LHSIIVNIQIDVLVLDALPKPLDEYVIDGPTFAIHADSYAPGL